jgi:hypothetical protein
MRLTFITVTVLALSVSSAFAQDERIGSAAPTPDYRSGWTLVPTVGIAEAYDDNITLFGVGTADGANNDYVTSFFPSADLHYEGQHTQFTTGYGGSFLRYRTFDGLDRWDQHGSVSLRRQETARLKWFASASGATRPETDLIELGGIPYRHTGSTEVTGRGSVSYDFNARDSVVFGTSYQNVQFQRSDLAADLFLRGGEIFDSTAEYRHRVSSRAAYGIDYVYRRARVVGDAEFFDLHGIEGAADFELSERWSVSGAGGIVYMMPTSLYAGRTGPAYRIGVAHHRDTTTVHADYIQSYIPAFGFGGIIRNEEATVGLRMQLFHSRRFYTDDSVTYRYDTPVVATDLQLPLRSVRGFAIFGWEADRHVRFEVFYARVDQTSLRPGGELYRNRVGFQIVTSMPMRIQ